MPDVILIAVSMVIPLWVAVYTWSFGRWLRKRGSGSAFPAYFLALSSLAAGGAAIWKILT